MTPLSGLITKGLGLPACESMIVAHFTLGLCGIVIAPVTHQVGVSRVLKPGQIKNMYKPVNNQYTPQVPLIPADLSTPKHYLSVKISLDGNNTHREFLLPEKSVKARTVVTISKFANKGTKMINATVKNLRLLSLKMKATISNFTKKDTD